MLLLLLWKFDRKERTSFKEQVHADFTCFEIEIKFSLFQERFGLQW